ncbi:DUF2252 domain-containing protein [Burkholderia sp. Ac-20345]|uniref:DUF2252 family protein n=1 Tax=Burkholderia sp. Ac-20345 TaxID=2703891 RepID=UPI00197C9CC3|nr:DUF2252 family protein [Burkholderia sp. Ac-20345]MBN3781463.1 DUF2252 domain-containing protein [Burkholderia sp. Ac-20345]
MSSQSQPKQKQTRLPKPAGRQAILTEQRCRKMARAPHAYVRGNTARFYEWLVETSGSALPHGPSIWIAA